MNPDVLFIGAGPIGLLAAIQLKLQCSDKEILMFEKYEHPIRNHAMYVEQSSFAGMDKSNGFGAILAGISSKVLISDLEKTLREYALSIGIKIQYQEIKNFNALKDQYPDTNYFIGSGGLRGIVHPQVFNDENQINEPLRYAVEVKYKAEGRARALNKVTELPGVLAYTKHLVSEYVGRLKDDLTPISLRIFIDETTYQAMKSATFKNPFTLKDQDKIPVDLVRTIDTYLKARQHLTAETCVKDSLKISTITLSIYASKVFCKNLDGKIVFQLGEEAFACPFYRSFNDNASCIPLFIKAMKALFANTNVEVNKISSSTFFSSSKTQKEPLEYYQHDVQRFVNSEIRTIYFLNTGIDVLETSVASSQTVPQFTGSKLKLKTGGKLFLEEVNRAKPEVEDNKEAYSAKSKCVIF
ncbi:Uncharacterised protein [Legionella beliardensis]|uniref:FAD dependent oxidoreductase n=1 Tax=Legionella beliardensis TaxID=91822 RepID=A0A378I2J9_9GAMM|nr:hypothetical protein [Legionella beliardensis]STX28886.1 Uncharacterised protein [Legionella beliardensis]